MLLCMEATVTKTRNLPSGLRRGFAAGVTPREHARIDAYLRELCGEDYGVLLRWLGTLQDRSMAAPALCLFGASGAGKSTLADALGRLVCGAPVLPWADVCGQYTGGLTSQPVVLVDERLRVGHVPEMVELFKSALTTDVWHANPKGRSKVRVLGHLRVVCAANSGQAFFHGCRVPADDTASQEALGRRLVLVRVPQAASGAGARLRDDLGEQGGMRALLEHLAWLTVDGPGAALDGDVPVALIRQWTSGSDTSVDEMELEDVWDLLAQGPDAGQQPVGMPPGHPRVVEIEGEWYASRKWVQAYLPRLSRGVWAAVQSTERRTYRSRAHGTVRYYRLDQAAFARARL